MTVDSAFLVNHIEWAFKVWREQPWGKHVDFDTFCEYILPYRIGDEPLSLWRKEIYECYSPILDEFRKTDEADNPKVAAQLLMDTLRKANYRNTALFPVGPHLGPDVLKWHTGSCREFTDAMIYVLRALGIPCGVDRVMVLGDNNASHFWNFVLDKEGKTYIANLPYEEVWSKAEEYSISRGKMYRATYSIDKEAVRKLGKYSDVYPAFRCPFFRDVTALYTGSRNWTVALPDSLLSGQFREGDMVYLCLANRLQWQPIGYTFFKKREARFEDVGGGAVFTLAAWNGKEYAAVSSPFLLERETGKIRFIVPEAEKQELVLYRKCHLTLSVLFNDRMIEYGYTPGTEGTSALRKLKEGIRAVRDLYAGPLVCHATSDFLMELELELAGKITAATFSKGGIDTKVPAVDGVPIIMTPSNRMYTAITLLDGKTGGQEAGGYKKGETAKNLNFFLCPRTTPIAITKQDVMRIFDPVTNQRANAWQMDYRRFHDIWILDNKLDSVFLNIKDNEG